MSMSLRSLALYIQPPAAPAATRPPQVILIMALLLCVLGSVDPALFWIV